MKTIEAKSSISPPQKANKFLSSVGGRETFYDKFSLTGNQILGEEQNREQKKNQIAIFNNLSLESPVQKRPRYVPTDQKPKHH